MIKILKEYCFKRKPIDLESILNLLHENKGWNLKKEITLRNTGLLMN